MSYDYITQPILQSSTIIAENIVKNANYDRTIQATIVSCVDPTIGKYKVNYQNGNWFAYSNNIDITYTPGSSVYVLIPANDMNNVKTILGTTKQLGINYINTIDEINKYEINGNNTLIDSNVHELCSYRPESIVLYDINNQENLINIDINATNTYIKNSSHFIVSAMVKTNLPIQQRYNGNYGLRFSLDFIDNGQGELVTRVYTLDVDTMEGNPYVLTSGITQRAFFEIDGNNFQRISKIQVFVKDFPFVAEDKDNDIFISNITFSGATLLSEQELNGVALLLNAPKGYIFNENNQNTDTRVVNAQVRVLGKVVDNNSQKLLYYWFVQDCTVTSKNKYYNKYGGQGWKCLNSYNVLSEDPETVQFNPAPAYCVISKDEASNKETKYKCVVIYDNSIISKQFTIINNDAEWNISITSDKGTQFSLDLGYPTLTCNVEGPQMAGIQYVWSETNSSGVFSSFDDQTDNYNEYKNKLQEYDNLKEAFESGNLLKNSFYDESETVTNIEYFESLQNEIKELEKTQYVIDDKIIHVNIKKITNFSTFNCSVFNGNHQLKGTASITLVNKLTSDGGYTLIINNGTQTFNYGVDGISPCSKSNENPFIIPSLSFTLFDMNGEQVNENAIKGEDIQWDVPENNTMIARMSQHGYVVGDTRIIKNQRILVYDIIEKYYANKTQNDITLKVTYQGYTLTAQTNLSFVKEGQNGTNGTGFVAKIVPIGSNGRQIKEYPLAITTNGSSFNFNFDHLNAQLWVNGEIIFNSNTDGVDEKAGKSVTLVWSMLINKYSALQSDKSNFKFQNNEIINNIDNLTNGINLKTLCEELNENQQSVNTPANIVKLALTYDGITYYATLPIISCYVSNGNYSGKLKQNTGFRYVTYEQDGRKPQYDNHTPFTFLINTKVNGIDQDISISQVDGFNPEYKFGYLSSIYQNNSRISKINLMNSILLGTGIKNQKAAKPIDSYDGLSVTNAVYCIATIGSDIVFIHVPIHFMLNKFGHAALNDWDGNSISIGDNGEQIILAPQIGAGRKDDNNNTFTGILMGSVKKSSSGQTQDGLFGYAAGVRSIFLDANTGNAEFGTEGKGQIRIHPGTEAIIEGGNYVSTIGSTEGTGMQINLTEPSIKFGSGHFSVNKDGNITAKDGGTIGGFTIGKKSSGDNYLYSGKTSYDSNQNGVYLGTDGIGLGEGKFYVKNDGSLYSTSGTIAGWEINPTSLTKDKVGINSLKEDDNSIAFWAGSTDPSSANFKVTYGGKITAKTGYIGNGSNGFTITDNYIYNGKTSYNSNTNGIYLGTNGIGLGKGKFYVNSTGTLHAQDGDIGGWKLTTDAIRSANDVTYNGTSGMYFGSAGLRLGANFHVDSNGNIFANSGNLGDWYINASGIANNKDADKASVKLYPDKLTIGNFYATAGGAVGNSTKDSWSITKEGKATFNNINITGGSMTGGTIGGKSSISGGSISPGSVSIGKGTMNKWCDDRAKDAITADFIKGKIAGMDNLAVKTLTISNVLSLTGTKGITVSNGVSGVNGNALGFAFAKGVCTAVPSVSGKTGSALGLSFSKGVCTEINTPNTTEGYLMTSGSVTVSVSGTVDGKNVTLSGTVSLPVTATKRDYYYS